MPQEKQLSTTPQENALGCAVLIYSTDSGFIEQYRQMLGSLDFVSITTTTPHATMAILRMLVVAFVLVDVGTGRPETRKILQYARTTQYHAPVLLIGRRTDPEFQHKALEMGAAAYLRHPALREDIVNVLLPNSKTQGLVQRVH